MILKGRVYSKKHERYTTWTVWFIETEDALHVELGEYVYLIGEGVQDWETLCVGCDENRLAVYDTETKKAELK